MTPMPYSVREVNKAAINHLVRSHYLQKWPGVVTACLGLFAESEPIGCIVFALPPAETNRRYDGAAWELARLFIKDETPKNTESWFIARAIRWVRSHHPDIGLLVSYADPSAGHMGTIYRASNWIFDGNTDADRRTPRFDLAVSVETLFGEVVHKYGRASHVPHGQTTKRIPRISKRRFVYWLNGHEPKRQRAAGGLQQQSEIYAPQA